MLFSFKVALQLNRKQLQTEILGSPSQINNGSGKQVQIYRVVKNDRRDLGTPLTLAGIECPPRSCGVVHNSSIHPPWSFFKKQSTFIPGWHVAMERWRGLQSSSLAVLRTADVASKASLERERERGNFLFFCLAVISFFTVKYWRRASGALLRMLWDKCW